MHAMMLKRFGAPLEWTELPDPEPGPGQIRIRIAACGVCRTDLHVVDQELAAPRVPIIPGTRDRRPRRRASAPASMDCASVSALACRGSATRAARASTARADTRTCAIRPSSPAIRVDGGFATATIADARYAFALDEDRHRRGPRTAAVCRTHRLARAGHRGRRTRVGFYGFGAAAHILAQVAAWQGRAVYAFTRTGDAAAQAFARRLGAVWAGDSTAPPPEPLDAAIIFAAVGELVPVALRAVRKGGRVVCAGIHMSDIPSFPYKLLWEERQLVSVANLTRQDAVDFLKLAPRAGVVTQTTPYPLTRANQALDDLRNGRFEGAAVLVP